MRRDRRTAANPHSSISAYLQLALFGAAIAPILLAGFAEDFTGLPSDSPEFLGAYREQLKRLIAHLAGPSEQATLAGRGGRPASGRDAQFAEDG